MLQLSRRRCPVPEVSVRVVDDELLMMGDHVNKGYLDSR